ncbi:MAG: hypothetical protein QXI42_07660 [Thermoproteota archaeon]|nr:hypothetical protein [Candidatus Brockarchaeota archaeon]
MSEPGTVTIKVPPWVREEIVVKDVEKLLEEKYGIVSAESLRKRFNIKTLREDINVDEHKVLALRESEKKRLQSL